MNEPLVIGLIVFAVILSGAVTGWKLRRLRRGEEVFCRDLKLVT
jgi:hypothetical protein